MHEHMVLKYLSIDSGIMRKHNSGFTMSIRRASMPQATAGIRCANMSARRLSSAKIAFLVGPMLPFTKTPLLKLSDIARTMRWEHFLSVLR